MGIVHPTIRPGTPPYNSKKYFNRQQTNAIGNLTMKGKL
jgi:hypothetical protein